MWLFLIGVSIFQVETKNDVDFDVTPGLRHLSNAIVFIPCPPMLPFIALYLVTLYFLFFLLSLPFVLLHLHRVNILPYSSQTLTTFVLVLLLALSFVPPSL